MNFEDAQEKSIEYLKSPEFEQREDTQSTLESIPTLIKIINAGFIRASSQEGDIKDGYNTTKQWYYEIKERAYITGYMKNNHALKFINKMNTSTDKVALKTYKTPTTPEKVFPDSRIAVSVHRKGAELPLSEPFTVSTAVNTVWPYDSCYIVCDSDELLTIYDEDVVRVVCFDPQYGRQAGGPDGLYQSILEHL